MNKHQRILIEALAPSFLATVILAATDRSDTFWMILAGFVPLLGSAYFFGFIPSVVYTLAMEVWFQMGLRARCGLLCTLGFSAILGAGAGFLSALLASPLGFTSSDCFHFLRMGALIGFLIAFYVGRRQTSGAQPVAAPNGGPAPATGNSGVGEGPPSVS